MSFLFQTMQMSDFVNIDDDKMAGCKVRIPPVAVVCGWSPDQVAGRLRI